MALLVAGRASERVPLLIYLILALRRRGRIRAASLLVRVLERSHGVFLGNEIRIGRNLRMPHPIGIVLGDRVVIGDDVTIYQGVTLGALRSGDGRKGQYPTVADGATIFVNSSVLGPVRIGERATIGAHSLVITDVPPGSVFVGAPARERQKKKDTDQ